jgi:aminoglycoside phosphotransferase (APT) family kinase protein
MIAGFERMVQAYHDAIKSFDGLEVCAEKIGKRDTKKLFTAFMDVAEPMRCGFQVLNHGDMWLNNMMFKSDEENNPLDVSMIDFQMGFWGGPASDILYFLISSVADDIKVDHFDNLIEFYHEQLSAALRKLNYDQHIPTLTEIHIDLLDKGIHGKI